MTETTTRIRWEPNGDGDVLMGYVGTRPGVAFRIYAPGHMNCRWLLSVRLIEGSKFIYADSPDELKAEAERWLAEFVSSLGAVFPEPLLELADRWQQFAARDDAADECARELREAVAGPGSVEDVAAASIERQSAYRNELRHLPGYMAAPATPAPMTAEKETTDG